MNVEACYLHVYRLCFHKNTPLTAPNLRHEAGMNASSGEYNTCTHTQT